MKTKLVYVLVSSPKDFFWEQCLISILSARYHMPECHITLVCDDSTNETFTGTRKQLLDFINEIIVVPFDARIQAVERSRLIKVSLRGRISDNYLYVDCDTLIIDDLSSIDKLDVCIGAVLEGHCLLKQHPMINYFRKQNRHLQYDFSSLTHYFNAGVMFVRDCEIAYKLYKLWHKNYKISATQGSYIDQPPLSLSNMQLGHVIDEIDGEWNCQVRFGALYLAKAKILHFCSKKNMPVHVLSEKSYLMKVKKFGVNTPLLFNYIHYWRNGFCPCIVASFGQDANFGLSITYEEERARFIDKTLQIGIYKPKKDIAERVLAIRNKIIGLISSKYLFKLLYKEKFNIDIESSEYTINRMIYELAFYSDISRWSELADKYKIRIYVAKCGLENILPELYGFWTNAKQLDFSELPNEFVLKCNHDNGSTLLISDKFSISKNFVIDYFRQRLKKKFGIETAEPHYRKIKPLIIAEEVIHNDKIYSDSLVSFKFFSFYGKAEYCQVVYNGAYHKNQKTIIYAVPKWEKKEGYILKNEGPIDIPKPDTLVEMLKIVDLLTHDLPFCRVDLYEYKNQVYFSELTFMPGCARIDSFSKEFLCILGLNLYNSKILWKL